MELLAIFEFLAMLSGIMLSLAYYPQIYKILKTKSTKDISLPSYIMLASGTTIWLVWGLLAENLTIIAGFLFGAIGSNIVLALVIRDWFKAKKSRKH